MNILIGADIVPTSSNVSSFVNGNICDLMDKDLVDVLNKADYRIFNLESPLSDTDTPITKCGPNFRAPTAAVNGIKAMGIDFVTLANNHIYDHGEQGVLSSIQALTKAKIANAGAGKNPVEAAEPYIVDWSEKKVGIYCCAEHEFSIVTNHSAGANPFDPLESLEHISDLKARCDYVIVLYHGGKEYYRYPSPYLQKVCRKIVEKGADLVVCQHSHCIGCKEEWRGGTIVYGQGNFLFDGKDNGYWKTSILLNVEIKNENKSISYIPIEKQGASVCLAKENAQQILDEFNQRSTQIKENDFICKNYDDFSKSLFKYYIENLQGKRYRNFLFLVLNKLSRNHLKEWLNYKYYQKKELAEILNILDCEAHRENFIYALKEKIR